MTELTCIVCPKGCRLTVDENNDCSVTGHSCPRGEEYGRIELTAPARTVTSTVRCEGGLYPRCPVKTDHPVPKSLIPAVMAALEEAALTAPVQLGQVVIERVCGTNANIVATRNMPPEA